MKELKDKYRGADMFELARQFNAGFDDVSVFGFVTFLMDNGYEIANYEQAATWQKQWMSRNNPLPNALNDSEKNGGDSESRNALKGTENFIGSKRTKEKE